MRVVQQRCQQHSYKIGTGCTQQCKCQRPAQHGKERRTNFSTQYGLIVLKADCFKNIYMIHIVIRKRNENSKNDWQYGKEQDGNHRGKYVSIRPVICMFFHSLAFLAGEAFTSYLPEFIREMPFLTCFSMFFAALCAEILPLSSSFILSEYGVQTCPSSAAVGIDSP